MLSVEFAANLYAALAVIAAMFQTALAAGAPWGHLTLGGRHPGRLPQTMRAGAAGQSALLLGMGLVIAGAGGVIGWQPPGWTVWLVLALTALTALGNLVTPSRSERRLWGPVSLVMLGAALIVIFA